VQVPKIALDFRFIDFRIIDVFRIIALLVSFRAGQPMQPAAPKQTAIQVLFR
jgi:hypothetical protein